jgi:hypothetical protein
MITWKCNWTRKIFQYKIIITIIFLLFCSSLNNVKAAIVFSIEDKALCTSSQVVFNNSSLEFIFLEPEKILENPKKFWQNDKAYQLIGELYKMMKRPIPMEKWKENIIPLSQLSREEREKNQYLLMGRELEKQEAKINSQAIPFVCSYLPKSEDLNIGFKVCFTAFSGGYRTMYHNTVVMNIAHPRWKESSHNIINNLVRILFDVGYRQFRETRTEKPLNKKIYGALEYLQVRGLSTYVGYKAQHLFSANKNAEYILLKDSDEVNALGKKLRDLFSKAETLSDKDFQTSSREIGLRGKAYYVFGAHMAKRIEEKLGRPALIQTINKGPYSFVTTYNNLVEQEEKILVPKSLLDQ